MGGVREGLAEVSDESRLLLVDNDREGLGVDPDDRDHAVGHVDHEEPTRSLHGDLRPMRLQLRELVGVELDPALAVPAGRVRRLAVLGRVAVAAHPRLDDRGGLAIRGLVLHRAGVVHRERRAGDRHR